MDNPRNPRLGVVVEVTLLFMLARSEMSGRLALVRMFSFLSASKVDLFLAFSVPWEKLGV